MNEKTIAGTRIRLVYRNSLRVAAENGLQTVAFPSISTGAFGFPVERAGRIALEAVAACVREGPFDEVRFVLFSASHFNTYNNALTRLH